MRSIALTGTMLLAVLALLMSCGRGGDNASTACTPNGNMTLHSSSTGTTLLSSITVTTAPTVSVAPVPVFAAYVSPPVAVIGAGYPPGATDPRTVGMNINPVGLPANNQAQFSLTFDSNLNPATYSATWRFVAFDAGSNIVGCRDLPVTFIIQ
jgi:hypothetical protein